MRSSFATFVTVLALVTFVSSADAGIKLKNPFKKDKGATSDSASVADPASSQDEQPKQKGNAWRGLKKVVDGAVNGVADGVTDLTLKIGNRQMERYGQEKAEKVANTKPEDKAAGSTKKDSLADKFIKAAGCNGPKGSWVSRCDDNALTRAADKRDADKTKK